MIGPIGGHPPQHPALPGQSPWSNGQPPYGGNPAYPPAQPPMNPNYQQNNQGYPKDKQ